MSGVLHSISKVFRWFMEFQGLPRDFRALQGVSSGFSCVSVNFRCVPSSGFWSVLGSFRRIHERHRGFK